MRILFAGAACAITLSLAACGQGSASENSIRASIREDVVQSCVTGLRGVPNANQLDLPRLCACATDRYMAGKSLEEVRTVNAQDPALRAAVQQCAMEQVEAGAGGASVGAEEENSAKPGD